ncbi:MerR family transcriptional regulator [Clostridium estertheticum]|uniref:MerR family transcriptional regulator n=1 Tax=Clostridium estertheticum TaxID=238834 RepID=UPI001CF25A3F|nr:MerR family transcriptional regulator [Clostridium estertheticum]MCB2354547.1 MerR family transcriptional regulator [Clostridium estertheticum]MCB2358474.1 MerR family transcriptional regulator [Clostridium estertheticum]WAG40798.1 MerR family transcriptional regulator [Clostridium estertheticum]
MKELFTIGEMAKLFNINIRSLRYYDEIGLLKPEYTNKITEYRYYSTKQFERLNTIKYLRALDMSIAKILNFFKYRDIDKLVNMLQQQQDEIVAKRRKLELIERKLHDRLIQIKDAVDTTYERIEEKYLPERKIAFLRKEISAQDDLEYPIKELELGNHLETVMFLGKIGVSVSKENLEQKIFGGFSSIFVLLDNEDGDKGKDRIIPASDYLTIRFQGTHKEANRYYLNLLEYMQSKEYSLIGDSIEITLIDYGMTNDTSKFVTELQIPYKKT